ncbi:E3 SUMO-protein ligase PIAS3-like [Dermacentor albipictus]|uniref:E3 SUMO-protein ligase PIAS3-like n=1 Tax=Dermacentor albipictus TaxID=60249 RepID=UPI0031FC3E9C
MLPPQPFYRPLRQVPLVAVPSPEDNGLYFNCGSYPAQSQGVGAASLLLICFAPVVEHSSLDGRTASLLLNGHAYYNMPFTMVNISPLLSHTGKNCFAIWDEAIPTKVGVRVVEAAKVTEDELLSSFDEGSPYAIRRENTEALVKAHFAEADETIVENFQVSLVCPLTKRKIRVPCRGTHCQHAQCFDAYAYLALNEGTLHPSWRCPVCSDQVLLQDIRIDLFTLDALRKADDQCSTVNLLPNGSWASVTDYDDHNVIIIEDSPVKETEGTLHNSFVIDLTVDSD